jgi:hypothetical protein
VPFAPGGGVDLTACLVSGQLDVRLGPTQRPIVAELQGFVKSEIDHWVDLVEQARIVNSIWRSQRNMTGGVWQC